jgi:hypothetical protein
LRRSFPSKRSAIVRQVVRTIRHPVSETLALPARLTFISRWKLGQAINAVTGTPRWGAVLPIQ